MSQSLTTAPRVGATRPPDVRDLALGGAVEPCHLPRTLRWRQERGGRMLRFDLAWPERMNEEGHPLVVVTDANAMFATLVETTRLQCVRPDPPDVREPVVLGIGHDTDALFDPAARAIDYASPGVALVLDVLAELMAALAARLPLSPTRRTLIGHSLGGLFTLTTLFERPELFARYVAASPSLWWAPAAVEIGAAGLPARLGPLPSRHLLLAAGGLERGWPRPEDAARLTPERRAILAERQVVEAAQTLAERLAAENPDHLSVHFHLFEGEGHASMVPRALSRAVPFALAEAPV
ncbi:alpha/beta hydrolase [Aquabacter sp. L1I39]|uniref:alpha/beta hydrolase n=1 Tax=Aquabacter sp. L1I39 TaxID=2820278 RepID=UPI001ADB42D4|nr:alpha/beta hydrolase-fold protein [Aquabacter sp. L1I39]QTL05687.1 alpha/beta hydrolase [Aquabacter sp. L1I39]